MIRAFSRGVRGVTLKLREMSSLNTGSAGANEVGGGVGAAVWVELPVGRDRVP